MTHKELILRAKEANTAKELLTLAKENGMELSEEDAELYLGMKQTGEIPDNALDEVSGGAAYTLTGGYLIVTNFHECDRWVCDQCGGTRFTYMTILEGKDWVHKCGGYPNGCGKGCATCQYMKYRFPFQVCTHPETRK